MSPELETLDQLLGGDLPLAVVRRIYPDEAHFARGLSGLLHTGEVRLITADGVELPRWRWREVLADPGAWPVVQVRLTPVGARRVC